MNVKTVFLLVSACSLLCALGCGSVRGPISGTGSPKEPRILTADEIPDVVRKIPKYTRFSYSGLSFFKGRLYAATNVGLIEFENAKPSKLYKWKDGDDVVSGPWLDVADDALWAMHDGLGKLIRFDGTTWRLIDIPTLKEGYTRGDVLRGFDGIGTREGFWFVGAGHAWRWNSATSSWTEPISPGRSSDLNLSALDRDLIAIAITEQMDGFRVEQSVHASDQGYVCTEDGQIFRATTKGIERMDSPGDCEAVAVSTSGVAAASFKGRGLFEFSDKWRKKFESPYGPKANEQWAHLAVTGSQYAFSVTAKANGYGDNKTYSGPTLLWVSVDSKLVPIELDKISPASK